MSFPNIRPALALCAGLIVVSQARAADSTVYMPVPFSTITRVNSKTFQPEGVIAAGNSGMFLLSADGTTFYAAERGSWSALGSVRAIDRASGKTLHSYKTQHPIWGGLAVSPDQSQLYVGTCSRSIDDYTCEAGNVEVLDLASGLELTLISMGIDQVFQIATAIDGATVYVVHYNNMPCLVSCEVRPETGSVPSGALTAIDAASLQVGASYTAPAFTMPQQVAIAPGGQYGYLFLSEEYVASGEIFEIDLSRMTLEGTIAQPSPGFGNIGTIALSANGATLVLLQNGYQDQLFFIDTATGSVTQTIGNIAGTIVSVGSGGNAYILNGSDISAVNAQTGSVTSVLVGRDILGAILSSQDGEFYLLSGGGSAVEAVSEGATTSSRAIGIGGPAMWLALSPDGGTLYAAGWNAGIWAISTATGQVAAKMLPDVLYMGAVAVSPNGKTLYAIAYQPNTLFILNAVTWALEKSVPLPACTTSSVGGAVVVSPKGGRIYAMQCGITSVVDAQTQAIIAQISGTSGLGLAISPKGDVVYVAQYSPATAIDVVDTATNKVTGTIPIPASSIAFSPDGSVAYVLSVQNDISGVAVIDTSTLAVANFIPGINGLGECAWDGCEGAGESVAVTRDGKFVYAGNAPGAAIDTQSLAIVGQFTSGGPVVIH